MAVTPYHPDTPCSECGEPGASYPRDARVYCAACAGVDPPPHETADRDAGHETPLEPERDEPNDRPAEPEPKAPASASGRYDDRRLDLRRLLAQPETPIPWVCDRLAARGFVTTL